MKREIEALLFASGRYMTVEEISDILETSEDVVQEGLELLRDEYEGSDSALTFVNMNTRWKMSVKADYGSVVQRVVADTELSTPVLETLAVIAWKHPILQSEVVDMRGSGAYDHIKELRSLEFITREQHGRTYKLQLSEKFFNYFDVHGEDEIRDVFDDVEQPEPDVDAQPSDDEEVPEPEPVQKEDLVEKRKVAQEELDELDEEIDAIREEAEQSIEELDELTGEEE